jgi:cytochrome c peroxidase
MTPVLDRLDARLRDAAPLSDEELGDLVAFVRDALLDPAAKPARLRGLVPATVPSGATPLTFQFR